MQHRLLPESCATVWGSCWVLSSRLSWHVGPVSNTPPDVWRSPVWSPVWPMGGRAVVTGRGATPTIHAAAKDHEAEVKRVGFLLSVLESKSAMSTGWGNWCSWDICHHVSSSSLFISLRNHFQKMVDILRPPLSFPTKTEAVKSPGFYLCGSNCKREVLFLQTYKKAEAQR